ncbi:PREDICTED: integrin alpha-D-like [Cyprinodon variegatus]|uniref:integrin alpha-D-like n=1 Tax=Cyprinodon variegatus TaxID=28743 RepID=UPI0007427462|nr:PREDICTED: integrin alpha-D-like [Cyprinodon variegatus]
MRAAMEWVTALTLFLSVFKTAPGFNVESKKWRSLSIPAAGFGYQVVQRTSDVLVSAPLEQYDTDKRGQIFRCSTERCDWLIDAEDKVKVNMSLGLSMTTDPSTKKTMVCGPTIPRDCKSITMYNGLCFEINPDNSLGQSYPSATEECRSEADIAFLLDGSGSVAHEDFNKMKAFVKNLIRAFLGKDTQFAITQFSSYPFTHYHFNNFPSQNWESEIDLITQQRGGTQTARAIREVVFCFVFRSRPVVMVRASVSFIPPQIPTQNPDCSKPLAGRATVCFTMSNLSKLKQAQAKINFTLTLDANREIPNNRAWISKNLREKDESLTLSLNRQTCQGVDFSIESCPEDALYPLNNALRFTFDGLTTGSEPLPSLSPQAQDTSFHSIGFEISCGPDSKCVDDLKVDFNFTKSSEVKVGIDELLNVTVFVENRGENSYNSHVILTYPIGLSFRKFETVEGRIECNSLDSEDGVTRGKTDCSINKPIFRSNSVAIFIVSYGHNPTSELDRKIYVTANATSGNNQSASTSVPYMKKEIDVKYSIYITTESSLSYNNFTYGENDLQKPLQQKLKVTNVIRALNFTIVIMVPVKLGDKEIWADTSSLKVDGCKKGEVVNPSVTDFIPQIKENKSLDCSVASCQVFRCSKFMEKNREETYTISGNISSRWIAQIGLLSAKFLLTSTANLEYDKSQFIFFSTTSNNDPPVHKIVAEVEVFQKPDFTKEIIGGSLGGLAFLLLLTAGLYKAGFFKSKYNQMINDNGEGDAGAGGDPPTEG